MSLERSNIAWSAKQIAAMVKSGKINFDSVVQRGLVWEKTRKSELIESLLLGYMVPPVIAKKTIVDPNARGGSVYSILDGKQRLTTIASYINDEFELCGLRNEIVFDDGDEMDVNGYKFSELHEELKDRIKDTMFSITYFENITDKEEKELFRRLNNGKALTSKSKMLASCDDINTLIEIGNHPLFEEMLTDKQRENKEQCILIIKMLTMLKSDISDVSFSGSTFTNVVADTVIDNSDRDLLEYVFNLVKGIHDVLIESDNKEVAKKVYTETHMLSMLPYLNKYSDGTSDKTLAQCIAYFFENVTQNYLDATSNAVASKTNIATRDVEFKNHFENYFSSSETEVA